MKNRMVIIASIVCILISLKIIAHKHEAVLLANAEKVSFDKPSEVREFPLGKVDLVKIGGAMVGRAVFQPGWKWSTSVKDIAKTSSCEAPHFQYHVSGHLRIKMDDGTILDCKAGDVSLLPKGHDAWVVGTEPVVVIDFQGMLDYAKSTPEK